MRSLDYRSGSVRLNDFEKQNHSLTDLKTHYSNISKTLASTGALYQVTLSIPLDTAHNWN